MIIPAISSIRLAKRWQAVGAAKKLALGKLLCVGLSIQSFRMRSFAGFAMVLHGNLTVYVLLFCYLFVFVY